jgi:hypothetical protein
VRHLAGVIAWAIAGCANVAAPPLPRPEAPASGVGFFARDPSRSPLPSATTEPPATPQRPVASPPSGPTSVSLGDIGGAGPLELIAASASGAWVALCEGEPMTAKLVLGSGSGEAIDSVDAADPSGRYVVATRGGVTTLFDASAGTRTDLSALGADMRRPRADYAEHRSLSFDATGARLAYLRRRGESHEIVVRQLADGSERAFAAGPGEVFRIRLSHDGRYVDFDALRGDSNGSGKLEWPVPEETSSNACASKRAPQFRSFGYQGRGDALTRALVDLANGSVRDVPELVTPLGTSLLLRAADGALVLEQAGKRRPLVPASCAARVVFADADRGLVLATCQPPKKKTKKGAPAPVNGKRELWLFGEGSAKNLQSELYETAVDRQAVVGVRLVAVYPGSAAAVLDLDRRELLPLEQGSRVLSTAGARALVWRGSDLYGYDAVTKSEQRLAHGVEKNPELMRAGNTVLLSPFVVVGASAPVLRSPPGALAVSTTGHVLTQPSPEPASSQGGQPSTIRGPLHWLDAKVPPPDGPPR